MSVSNALRRIAEVVDGVEAEDVEVRDAAMPTDRAAISDGKVHVTLDLAIALDGVAGENSESAERSTDGREQDEQAVVSGIVSEATETTTAEPASVTTQEQSDGQQSQAPDPVDETEGDDESRSVEVEPASGQSDDGTVVCPEPGCDATFESEPGMKIHRTKIHLREGSTDDSSTATPAYRDPEALEEVYEAHDSFPAMREALDVDVSAQTIRRHMIQHGIHDPSGDAETGDPDTDSGDETGEIEEPEPETDADGGVEDDAPDAPEPDEQRTEAGADDQTPDEQRTEDVTDDQTPDEPDEADEEPAIPESAPLAETLPEHVTAPEAITFAELKEAVRTADTLYHIQQQFDLTREEARDLLGSLDLLELVHGRVATKHEREELKAEIDSRIRHNIRGNGTSA